MSLHGRMRDDFAIYERTAEADTLTRVATVRGYTTQLSADGARRQSVNLDPDVTHSGRFAKDDEIIAGRRVRRLSDDHEWTIKTVREQGPPPGHYHVLLADAEANLT